MNIDWHAEAVCATVDPYLFHPVNGAHSAIAVGICNGTGDEAPCPVKDKCLEWALRFESVAGAISVGVYGGTTAPEREAILAERGIRRCADCAGVIPDIPQTIRCDECRDAHGRAVDAAAYRRSVA